MEIGSTPGRRRRTRTTALVGLLGIAPVLAASAASTASAQTATLATSTPRAALEVRAEGRFHEGSTAFEAGRIDEACVAFADSLATYATLGALLNLALCHEMQGKAASAWREFTLAAAWASAPLQQDRHGFAVQHAQRLERALSSIVVDVPADDDALVVAIDGQPLQGHARLLPVFVDAGDHVVSAAEPGRRTFVSTVHVEASRLAEPLVVPIPELEPETVAAPVTAATVPPTLPSAARRTTGWIVGGAGLAALGVGAAFGVAAIAETGSCRNGCDAAPARTAEAIALVALGTGAAALVTGAWFVWTAPSGPRSVGRLRVIPSASAHGAEVHFVSAW